MRKIVIAGVSPPSLLGDLLQYYVLFNLLRSQLPQTNIDIICPHCPDGQIDINAHEKLHAINLNLNHVSLVKHYLPQRTVSTKTNDLPVEQFHMLGSNPKALIGNRIYNSYILARTFGSAIAGSMFSFDGGLLSGHTMCDYHHFLQYVLLPSIVKGPLVTAPISVSEEALKHISAEHRGFNSILRRALESFDFIFLRGTYSLNVLRDEIGVNEEKLGIALDSGFGLKLLQPKPCGTRDLHIDRLKVVIIPRKDYFFSFKRQGLYRYYLKSLVNLIIRLNDLHSDLQICLCSQTTLDNQLSDQAAIRDLMHMLSNSQEATKVPCPMVIPPTTLGDAYDVFSSADLVITSRLHGGILALNSAVPTFFLLPSGDVKTLDVLSYLHLDSDVYSVDVFSMASLRSLSEKAEHLLSMGNFHKQIIAKSIDKALPTLQDPIKRLNELTTNR
jgi:hypothetical protein